MLKPLIVIGSLLFLAPSTLTQINKLNLRMLPIAETDHEYTFIHKYTKFLNDKYEFKTFIIFGNNRLYTEPTGYYVRSLHRSLGEDFDSPIIKWGMRRGKKLRHIIGLNNLVFVQIDDMMDPILNIVDEMLEGLHFITILFFYKHPKNMQPTSAQIKQLFEWCWERNIINAALLLQRIQKVNNEYGFPILDVQDQVFSYKAFPNLTIHNLTECIYDQNCNFVSDQISNVHGYEFVTPIFKQVPTVFLTRACNRHNVCESTITGTAGRIYAEYIKRINGTIRLLRYPNTTYEESYLKILFAASNKEIHIGIHPFSQLRYIMNYTEGTYPIAQTNTCVIVPHVSDISLSEYIFRAFQAPVWLLFFATFLLLLTIFRFTIRSDFNNGVGHFFLYGVHAILNQPYTKAALEKRSVGMKLFHLKMFIMIFIICSIYTCSLTSFFNILPAGKQINTMEDFLGTDLKILSTLHQKRIVFDSGRLPAALLARLLITDPRTLEHHQNALNTTYAYLMASEQWKIAQIQQKQLWKPRFHMPSNELCTSTYFVKFPIQWDSPFAMSLQFFFMATHESGLSLKWRELSISQAQKSKLIDTIKVEEELWKPISLKHFQYLGIACGVLWTLSIICFITEIIWHKLQRST